MNVSLTPELEKKVRDLVETGQYSSSSEVMREALRIMFREASPHLSRFDRAILASQRDIDQGRLVPFDDEFRSHFEENVDEFRKLNVPLDPDVVV